MIRFSCVCGEKFEVPADCAGDELQCPACKRLVSVPQLGDLDAFADDGTVKLTDREQAESELAEKMHAFSYRDDMRRNVEEFLLVGEDSPVEKPPPRLAPRYDPETGELVTEIPVKQDVVKDRPQDIPMATPTLGYAAHAVVDSADPTVKWYEMPWRLLKGQSLAAMTFVFLSHALIHFMLSMPLLGILLVPMAFLIFLAIVAHYCNVIEDFGPHESDRVPVMLRNVSFSEDIVHPLYSLGIGILFAFGPAIILKLCGLGPWTKYPQFFWAAMALGLFVFPAGVFTTVCSGALQNLMPQHSLSVIKAAPMRYVLATLLFAVSIASYAVAIGAIGFTGGAAQTLMFSNAGAGGSRFAPLAIGTGITYVFSALAIYCMHLSTSWLGMIYRTHYKKLNWILQHHERAHRNDTNARLAQMRKQGDPRIHPAVLAKRNQQQQMQRPASAAQPVIPAPKA